MAATLKFAPSASPPPPAPTAVAAVFLETEVPSRPLMDEVLQEEFRTEDDIAFAQVGISLAMSIEDIFGFLAEFPSSIVPNIQGEPTLVPEVEPDHLQS